MSMRTAELLQEQQAHVAELESLVKRQRQINNEAMGHSRALQNRLDQIERDIRRLNQVSIQLDQKSKQSDAKHRIDCGTILANACREKIKHESLVTLPQLHRDFIDTCNSDVNEMKRIIDNELDPMIQSIENERNELRKRVEQVTNALDGMKRYEKSASHVTRAYFKRFKVDYNARRLAKLRASHQSIDNSLVEDTSKLEAATQSRRNAESTRERIYIQLQSQQQNVKKEQESLRTLIRECTTMRQRIHQLEAQQSKRQEVVESIVEDTESQNLEWKRAVEAKEDEFNRLNVELNDLRQNRVEDMTRQSFRSAMEKRRSLDRDRSNIH